MATTPPPSHDRYAHLRAHATARKQATVERLRGAITQLESEGRSITTFTIKEVSGLDYMSYYRNSEALTLFRSHSTHLRQERQKRRQSKHKREARDLSGQEVVVSARDPLLHYKKPRLVAELRAARAKHDHMQQQYQALLQEHMHCGLAITRLETQLAEHQAFLERFRSSLQKEEYGPQS